MTEKDGVVTVNVPDKLLRTVEKQVATLIAAVEERVPEGTWNFDEVSVDFPNPIDGLWAETVEFRVRA
jgi:hypothetical protein